jgi:hypothetical protein
VSDLAALIEKLQQRTKWGAGWCFTVSRNITFKASNMVLQLDETMFKSVKKKDGDKVKPKTHIPMAELLLRRSGPCPSTPADLASSCLRGALRCSASGGGN